MTKLGKSVTRESAVFDRGRALIVTLHPRHIEVRPKGLRKSWSISYDACMWLGIKREMEEQRREKAIARKKGNYIDDYSGIEKARG